MPVSEDEVAGLLSSTSGAGVSEDEVAQLLGGSGAGPAEAAPAPGPERDLPENAFSQAAPVYLGSGQDTKGRVVPVVNVTSAEDQYQADLVSKAERLRNLMTGFSIKTQGGVDRHASVLRLANETGMRFDTADANFDLLAQEQHMAAQHPVEWMKANPDLAQLLFERPELAPVVVKDHKLNALSRAWNWAEDQDTALQNKLGIAAPWHPPLTPEQQAARDAPKQETLVEDEQAKAVREGGWQFIGGLPFPVHSSWLVPGYRFSEAWQQQKISRSGYELLLARGRGDEQAAEEIQARIHDQRLDAVRRNYDEGEAGRVFSSMATAAASTSYGLKEAGVVGGVAAAVVGGATLAITKNPAASGEAAMSAGSLFGKAGAVKGTFELEAGNAYLSLLDAKGKDGLPIPEETARTAAAIYGVLASGVEFASWGPMLKAMGPLGELIKHGEVKAVTSAMVHNDAFKAALRHSAKHWLPAAIAEGGEEGIQDALEQSITLLATGHTVSEIPANFKGQQTLEATGEGIIGGVGLGGIAVATGMYSAAAQRDRALAGGQVIAGLAGLKDSPTVKAAPGVVAKLVERATARLGEPVTAMHVDAPAFVKLFQQQGGDANQAITDLMGEEGPRLLQDALAQGKRLEVPVAKYLERWGGTETAKALAADTSTSATAPTLRDIADFDAAVKEAAKNVEKEAPTSEGEADFIDAAEKQLAKVQGEGQAKARLQLNLWRGLVRSMQERLGTNADEFFKGLALRVEEASATEDVEGNPILGTDLLFKRAEASHLSPEQRGVMRTDEFFRDQNTGILNDEAHKATPAPEGKLAGHISVEGIKYINDNADHETADLLYRAVAKALHGIDPTVAKVGGDFRVYVKDQAELDAVLQLVRESLPEQLKGFEITGAVGKTYDEAGKANGKANAERIAKGERANPRPLHPTLLNEYGEPETLAPEKPKGLKGDLKDLVFPTEKVRAEVSPELAKQVTELTPAQYLDKAYRDQKTGEWTARGWAALPRKAHVVSIDLKGLRHVNDTFGPEFGDAMLETMGRWAQKLGGVDFDFSHLHGDEYAAQSDDLKALEAFVQELDTMLERYPVQYEETETPGKLTPLPVEFHHGFGERSLEAADRDLNDRKAAFKKARAAGLVRRRGERSGPEAVQRGPGSGDRAGGEQGAHAGEVDQYAEGRAAIGRMRSNKADAQAFLDYVEGKRERPRISPALERLLGRHGIVDPLGFPFDENGRDLRRPMKSQGYFNSRGIGLVGNAADAYANRKVQPMSRAFYQPGGEKTSPFKAWFGDSKVVDEKGKPLRVFHGSKSSGFDTFKLDLQDPQALYGPGFYFTEDPSIASEYTDKEARLAGESGASPGVYPVFLSIKNPLVATNGEPAAALVDQLQKFKAKQPPADIKKMIDSALRDESTNFSVEGLGAWIDNTEWAYKIADKAGKNGEELLAPHFDYIVAKARDHIVKMIRKGGAEMSTGLDVLTFIDKNVMPMFKPDQSNIRQVLEMLGFDGITHTGGGMVGGGDHLHRVWIAFEPTQVKSAIGNRGTFDSKDPNILHGGGEKGKAPRGFTELNVTKEAQKLFKVALTEQQDLSTFLHESGHVFLKLMSQAVEDPNADEQLKADWDTALKWLGADSFEKLTTEQHEKWARGFERYLHEGKAPSAKLKAAFSAFKLWLKGIYRTFAGHNVELNDEIRGVFDRLLATDREIEQQRSRMGFSTPTAQEILGYSPKEYAQYLDERQAATEHAALQAEHTAMKETLRVHEKWWREELKQERQRAEEAYEQLPARVAEQTLQGKGELVMAGMDGPLRLAREDVVAAVGEANAKKFKTTTKAGEKVSPNEVAQFLGFPTGQAMLEGVLSLPDKTKWVKATALQAMADKHGDVLEERQRLADIVSKGLHGDMTARVLAREAAALVTRLPGAAVTPDDVIRAAAKQRVSEMTLGKLDPSAALAAERKAANDYAKACATQNFQQALIFKNRQRLNMYVWRELTAAREMRDDLLALADKLGDRKARFRLGKGHPLFLGGVDLLLESLGLKEPSPREKPLPSLGEVVTELMKFDTVGFDEQVLEGVLARATAPANGWARVDFRTLTVAEAKNVLGALTNIEAAARDRATVLIDGKRIAKEDAKAKLQQSAAANLPPKPPPPTPGAETPRQWLGGWWNAHDGEMRKPEFMLNRLGGRDIHSPWHQFIVKQLQAAKHLEADLMSKHAEPLLAALKKLAATGRAMETIDGKALFPQHTDKAGLPQRRFELWVMLLNGGNESNLERLTLGRGITEQQIRDAAVKVGITEEETDAIQAVIDSFEEIGRLSFDLEERDSGLRPDKVEARQWVGPSGKKYRGGYFPAVYDFNVTRVGAQQEAQQLFDPGYVRPGTARGHLKSRVEGFNDVISLSPQSITRHIAQVIHDLAYRERLKAVANLLLDDDVQQTMRTYLGVGKTAVFPQYLRDVGQMRGTESVRTPKLTGIVRWARGNLPAVLGYRLKNAVEDYVTTLSTACIGTGLQLRHLSAGVEAISYYDRTAMADAEARSGELRARLQHIDRELLQKQAELTQYDIPGRKALRYYKDHAQVFQKMADRAGSAIVYIAAERQYLEQHAEDENTEKTKSDAVVFADAMVRKVMHSHSPVDASALMRDKGPVGSFLVFFGFFNHAYNREADIIEQAIDAKTGRERAMKLGAALGFMFAVSVWGSVVRGQGPGPGDEPDDEKDPKMRALLKARNYTVRKLLVGTAELHPLTGPLGQAGEAWWLGKKQAGVRNNSVVGIFESVAKSYLQAIDENKDPDVRLKAFLRTLEPTLGIPTGQAADTGGYLWDWYQGDVQPRGPGDVLGGLYAGEKPGQGANPFTLMQDAAGALRH
jgi:GGDEF domain-containing protein